MAYLDVSPMMVALRTTPEEFEFSHGWLHHTPSRHSFSFNPEGRVQLRADCNCSLLAIKSDQEEALAACYNEWQANYWRPLQINREFASHFRPRSRVRQLLIDLTARVQRWLLRQGSTAYPRGIMYPAE
ncbi:MAG TPA: hypothetical protein VFA53_02785 [Xanthobacteraceae bacterium]|nr:hypothetical protein [Xanthobacteraceae bacterium]